MYMKSLVRLQVRVKHPGTDDRGGLCVVSWHVTHDAHMHSITAVASSKVVLHSSSSREFPVYEIFLARS